MGQTRPPVPVSLANAPQPHGAASVGKHTTEDGLVIARNFEPTPSLSLRLNATLSATFARRGGEPNAFATGNSLGCKTVEGDAPPDSTLASDQ